MKVLASMIEYNGCKRCKSKIIRNSQHCKPCRSIINKSLTFLSYEEEQKVKIRKNRTKDNIWIITSAPIQHSCPTQSMGMERNTYAYIKTARFRDLEHFTSFIINSKRVSYSQLIITLYFDLNNVPEIRKIFESSALSHNSFDLPLDNYQLPPIARNLQVLFQSKFWDELISLYIARFHTFIAIFNLKYFNPKSTPPSLLAAIHYCGYQYYTQKTPELTDYMESFAKSNLKRILFKPSLANAQSILIYSYTYQSRGELCLARKYQSHLVNVCSGLGVHIDCKQFDNSRNFNRKALFLKLSIANNSLNGALKPYLNYVPDLPEFDKGLYDPSWQLLPPHLNRFADPDKLKRELSSIYTTIIHEYCDRILYLLNVKDISEICCKTFERLSSYYTKHSNMIQNLMFRYPQFASELGLFESFIKLSYYDMGIGILDELRINPLTEAYSIRKMLELSDSIVDLLITSEALHNFYDYYLHLAALTYLNCHLSSNRITQQLTKLKFERILNYLRSRPNTNKFFTLILKTGLKLIN